MRGSGECESEIGQKMHNHNNNHSKQTKTFSSAQDEETNTGGKNRRVSAWEFSSKYENDNIKSFLSNSKRDKFAFFHFWFSWKRLSFTIIFNILSHTHTSKKAYIPLLEKPKKVNAFQGHCWSLARSAKISLKEKCCLLFCKYVVRIMSQRY